MLRILGTALRLLPSTKAWILQPERQYFATLAADRLPSETVATTSPSATQPAALPHILQIPEHTIEDGLPEVTVWLRPHSGTNYCSKLRKGGLTPCVLFSLPGNESASLLMDNRDAAQLVRQYGRNGLHAQVLKLNITQSPSSSSSSKRSRKSSNNSSSDSSNRGSIDLQVGAAAETQPIASVRVLPKAVHMNSVTLDVENFRFMFCPPDRRVTVNVPVKLWNDDISPGVKSGGWLHVVNRTVPLLCLGWAIKPFIELDVRHMAVRDVLRYRDVPLPEGCQLHVKDALQPVVHCAARVGGD